MTKSIQQRFEEFDAANPQVYRLLVAEANKLLSLGWTKCAIGFLWERVRWVLEVEVTDPNFSEYAELNDHYRSRYARKLMAMEPQLVGFFEIRRLRAE